MLTATAAPPSTGFYFDEYAADTAVRFFEKYLRHVKGELAGQPLVLQEWAQRDIIRPTFGWKRPDGTRKYRTVYVEVPRKNAKSTIAAGVALYLLLADKEPGAEVYSAAADRKQAGAVFDVAKMMVAADPSLRARAKPWRDSIVVKETNSSYKALSAEAYSKHGFNAHGIVFDELHALSTRDLWDVLTTSVGSRRQPLIFVITTAGYDRRSICYELHDYALKVRDGIIEDPSFLPVIYAADEGTDWRSDEALEQANPGIGVTVKRDYLEAERQKAIEIPGKQNAYKQLHLDIWTEQASRWIDMATWEDQPPRRSLEELKGQVCFAGIDLAATTDLTALVLVFPNDEGGCDALPFFWIPEDNMRQRSHRDRVPYDLWAEQGFIEVTQGNIMDNAWIRKRVNELADEYSIQEIMVDRAFNGWELMANLQGDGFTVGGHSQSFVAMGAASLAFERLVQGRLFRHGGNPVLRWNASNVAVTRDSAGLIKPDKEKSNERIDGVVAAIMAVGRMEAFQEQEPQMPGVLPLY